VKSPLDPLISFALAEPSCPPGSSGPAWMCAVAQMAVSGKGTGLRKLDHETATLARLQAAMVLGFEFQDSDRNAFNVREKRAFVTTEIKDILRAQHWGERIKWREE
jgi:hypothetical protein